MSARKKNKNTTGILKLLFFTINVHFITSNQILTYRKSDLPLTSGIYLVFLLLEMQGRLKQTRQYQTFLLFYWKVTTQKPLKVAVAKTLFSSVYIIATTCFLFYVITENYTFHNSLLFFWNCFNCHVVAFFGASVLKEVRNLCVISTITVVCSN